MAADGSLFFDVGVNTSDFEDAAEEISSEARNVGQEVENSSDEAVRSSQEAGEQISQIADETSQKIQDILNDVTRSQRSQAASIAAIYREQGMNQSEAMQQAWANIERGTQESGRQISRTAQETSDSISSVSENSSESIKNGKEKVVSACEGMKSVLAKVAVAVGTAFSVKEIIETGAEVKALNSQFEQTFGELQSNAQSSINGVAKQSGILESRLKGVGTSIYAFAKSSGMESAQALDMMNEALQVTADSAAYYDKSLEETGETLKSFLKGNFENDAALGISCTETTRNIAANKLYGKSYQELSEAQKQLTLLQMVKDANALSGAMGQAAREADGWENVTGNLKESWKQLLAVVGQPILALAVPIVKNLTAAIQQLTSAASSAINALAEVFGVELDNSSSQVSYNTEQVSDNAESAAESYETMSQAAEETQEANENSLASFDKINKLGDDKPGNSKANTTNNAGQNTPLNIGNQEISVTPVVDTSSAADSLREFFKSVKKNFQNIMKPFKDAWNKQGKKVVNAVRYAFKEIWELIKSIGKSFETVWTNGTGTEILEHLLIIFANINTLIGNIAKSFRTAWNTDNIGTDIVQDMADILNTILEHIDNISKKCSDWAKTLDFTPLLNALDELLQAVEPFTDNIGEGLEWFFDNVLLPLASWTIEDAIPTFLTALSDVISGLSSAWDTAAPVIEDKLWKGFLQPIAKWTGGAALSLLKTLGKAVKDIGESITKEQVDVLIDLSGAVGAIILAVKGKKYVDDFVNSLKNLGSNAGTALSGFTGAMKSDISKSAAEGGASFGTKFMASAGALLAGWQIGSIIRDEVFGGDKIDEFFFPIFDAIVEFFTETIPNAASTFAESLQETMDSIYDSISGLWNSVSTFFTETIPDAISMFIESLQETMDGIYDSAVNMWNNIVSFFTESIPAFFTETVPGFFSDLWESIKETFKDVKDWFKKKFESAGNGIKEAFSSIGSFFSGIWDKVKKPFVDAGKWFKEKFNDVVDGIGSAFNRISDIVKKPVNWIIDGINTMIRGLNSMSFDVPDWVPKIGGNSFGINIPEIPRLATGAVIPPNKEFLAVLGDQKSGTNVEAPLETIKQAVAEVMAVYGGSGNQKISLTIPLILRNKTISQVVIDDINDYIRRNGTSPIGG